MVESKYNYLHNIFFLWEIKQKVYSVFFVLLNCFLSNIKYINHDVIFFYNDL